MYIAWFILSGFCFLAYMDSVLGMDPNPNLHLLILSVSFVLIGYLDILRKKLIELQRKDTATKQ
jgi:hypothetical protein